LGILIIIFTFVEQEFVLSVKNKHHIIMKKLFLLLLTIATVQLNAQDLAHYKKVVKSLSSAK
jgi:hypothetical protein